MIGRFKNSRPRLFCLHAQCAQLHEEKIDGCGLKIFREMAKEVRFNKFSLIILITLGVVVSLFIISKMENYSEEHIKLSELISASIDLAQRGGKRVVEVRSMSDSEIGQLSKGRTKEGKKEYVTIGDKVGRKVNSLTSNSITFLS